MAWASRTGLVVGIDDEVEWANPSARSLLGTGDQPLGGHVLTEIEIVRVLDHPGASGDEPTTLHDLLVGSSSYATLVVRRLDGTEAPLHVESSTVDDGLQRMTYLTIWPGEQALDDQRKLELSHAKFGALASHAPVAVCVSDIGMRIAFANERMCTIWGQEGEQLLGTGWMDSVVEEHLSDLRATIARVLSGQESDVSIAVERPDGERRELECRFAPVEREDRSVGFVATAEDVTDLRRHQEQLAWQAHHDSLTHLANREALHERCAELLEAREPFALLFLDLDDFKLVNDGLGHAAGDELLCTIARRLRRSCRSTDMVCRLGGDEFVVVLGGVTGYEVASEAGTTILESLSRPVELEGTVVEVSASVGVVLADHTVADVPSLLRDADVAMYQAKRGGKGRVASFADEARAEIQARVEILSDLRAAIKDGDIRLAFQPIVQTDVGAVVGAEALLRYTHPVLGVVPPPTVVALAEEAGLHCELGNVVLENAVAQMCEWLTDANSAHLGYVSVNVSARQVTEDRFAGDVIDILTRHGLPARFLTIELTETQIMTDVEKAVTALETLAETGVGIAIDDFGTGHSSLAYLARLPFSIVKVDRAFVGDLPGSSSALAIIEALVNLARALEADVIVEGVETPEQLEVVTDLGCTLVQGYLLGRPGPADHIAGVSRPEPTEHLQKAVS